MPRLTFYPLGNADCCLVGLVDGTQILFDYAATRDSNNKQDKRIDLAVELRRDLKKAKRDSFRAVVFTHLDNDHVKGAQDFFFLDHAECYQKGDRFKIEELWVPAAAIIEEGCEDDARIVRAEARHRLKKGYGIRVFSRPEKLKMWLEDQGIPFDSRKHLFVDAGQLVPSFSIPTDGVEFFVHSPFASRLNDTEVVDRNIDSIFIQAVFAVEAKTTNVILGSDLPYEALAEIVKITKARGRASRLEWDVFKMPHHCSYKSIGPDRGAEKAKPTEETKWLFEEQALPGAILISTSDLIPAKGSEADKGKQPPHRQAYNYHKGHIDDNSGELHVTMQHPKITAPERLTIEIDNTKARVVKGGSSGVQIITSQSAPRAGTI